MCQLVTCLQALLGSIAWTLSETQAACFHREVPWSLDIAVLHKSSCRGFSHHPADSTGWVSLAKIYSSHKDGGSLTRQAQLTPVTLLVDTSH